MYEFLLFLILTPLLRNTLNQIETTEAPGAVGTEPQALCRVAQVHYGSLTKPKGKKVNTRNQRFYSGIQRLQLRNAALLDRVQMGARHSETALRGQWARSRAITLGTRLLRMVWVRCSGVLTCWGQVPINLPPSNYHRNGTGEIALQLHPPNRQKIGNPRLLGRFWNISKIHLVPGMSPRLALSHSSALAGRAFSRGRLCFLSWPSPRV